MSISQKYPLIASSSIPLSYDEILKQNQKLLNEIKDLTMQLDIIRIQNQKISKKNKLLQALQLNQLKNLQNVLSLSILQTDQIDQLKDKNLKITEQHANLQQQYKLVKTRFQNAQLNNRKSKQDSIQILKNQIKELQETIISKNQQTKNQEFINSIQIQTFKNQITLLENKYSDLLKQKQQMMMKVNQYEQSITKIKQEYVMKIDLLQKEMNEQNININYLQKIIQDYKIQISQLQRQKSEYELKFITIQKNDQKQQSNRIDLQKQNVQNIKKIQELEKYCKNLNEKLQLLEVQKNNIINNSQSINQKEAIIQNEKKQLQKKYKILQNQLQNLKAQSNQYKSQHERININQLIQQVFHQKISMILDEQKKRKQLNKIKNQLTAMIEKIAENYSKQLE